MTIIKSTLSTSSEEFRQRYAHNKKAVAELREMQHAARMIRPQRDLDRLSKQGKMLPRERLEKLLDPGTPFLEFSTLAANRAYNGESPSASCITGIGTISGREVVIHADDSSVKGGAWYPLTVKKIVRALEIALENHLPMVHLCDSAGGQLQLQSDLFPDKHLAGRMFRHQAMMSKYGNQAAGPGFRPVHRRRRLYSGPVRLQRHRARTGAVFLGGPPLVKAATGAIVTSEELGGCDMHTQISGTCDYPADTEDDAIRIGRDIVAQWEMPKKWSIQQAVPEAPLYDPTSYTALFRTTSKKASRCARLSPASSMAAASTNISRPMAIRWLRLCQYLGLQDRHPRQ